VSFIWWSPIVVIFWLSTDSSAVAEACSSSLSTTFGHSGDNKSNALSQYSGVSTLSVTI